MLEAEAWELVRVNVSLCALAVRPFCSYDLRLMLLD